MPARSLPLPIPQSGMNRVPEQMAIEDANAWYLQDALNDFPGKLRQRGDVKALANYASVMDWIPEAVAVTNNPSGESRIALFGRTLAGNTPQIKLLTSDGSAVSTTISVGGMNAAAFVADVAPVIGGGLLITALQNWRRSDQAVARYYWRGAVKAAYATGTITATKNSTTVEGASTVWLANVEPGMFLIETSNGSLLGVVSSVTDNTHLELEQFTRIPKAPGSGYSLIALRKSFPVNVAKGTITCSTGSTTVTGAGTNWEDNFLASATNYVLNRASDLTFIGTVASVTNDTTLTLDNNAEIAMSAEEYIAFPITLNCQPTGAGEDTYPIGILSVPYANRQFYANWPDDNEPAVEDLPSRTWYSEPIDFESVDVSIAGDFFDIPHRGNAPSYLNSIEATPQALLTVKGNVSYAVTGNSPSQFVVRHLLDDGCLDSRGIQYFEDTVIWPGILGIYAYDGLTVANLVEANLGQFYQEMVKSLTPITNRIGSAIHKDHYFLYFDAITQPEGVIKDGIETNRTRITVVINLRTLAVSLWTNLGIYASSLTPPPTTPRCLMVVYDTNDDTKFVDPDQLFVETQTANDTITSKSHTAGPDFYWESKLFPLVPEDLRKYIKFLELNYRTSDGALTVETFTNLDEDAIVAPAALPDLNGHFDRKRVNVFRRLAPFFGFRVYKEDTATKNIAVIQARVASKPHREGA